MAVVKSGKYAPNNAVEVVSWEEGGDPPEGYEVLQSEGTNQSVAVKKNKRGQVERDPNGNALSVAEGSTLVVDAQGYGKVLTTDEEVDEFSRAYEAEKVDPPTNPPADTPPADTPPADTPPAAPDGQGS